MFLCGFSSLLWFVVFFLSFHSLGTPRILQKRLILSVAVLFVLSTCTSIRSSEPSRLILSARIPFVTTKMCRWMIKCIRICSHSVTESNLIRRSWTNLRYVSSMYLSFSCVSVDYCVHLSVCISLSFLFSLSLSFIGLHLDFRDWLQHTSLSH